MLEEGLFIYSKLSTEDNRRLKRVIASLSAYVDRTGWDGAVEEIFMAKVLRKLNNLRVEMLNSREIVLQGSGYRTARDQEDTGPRTTEACNLIEKALDLAADDEREGLIHRVLTLTARKVAMRAIVNWMVLQEF
jgi:hypothetical protein